MTDRLPRPPTPVQVTPNPEPEQNFRTLSPIVQRRTAFPPGSPSISAERAKEVITEARTFIQTADRVADFASGIAILRGLREIERFSTRESDYDTVHALILEIREILGPQRVITFEGEEGGPQPMDVQDELPGEEDEEQRIVAEMLDPTREIEREEVTITRRHNMKGRYGIILEGEFHGTPVIAKKLAEVTYENAKLFRREINMLDMVRGDYTCQLLGWCRPPLMMVTTRYPRTLTQGVDGVNALNIDERVRAVFQIGTGIKMMHVIGIIHNDIKLDNIFLDWNNCVKIGDFGHACRADSPDVRNPNRGGNILHRSPEDLRGDARTYKSDVYSFGILVFETFFGTPWFGGNNRVGHEQDFINYVTTPGRNVIPEDEIFWMRNDDDTTRLSEEFWRAVMKCWSYYPDERPTMEQIVNSINEYGVRSAIPKSRTTEMFWHECCGREYNDKLAITHVASKSLSVPDVNLSWALRVICKDPEFITIREFWRSCCWFPNWFNTELSQHEMKGVLMERWFVLTKEEGRRRLEAVPRGRYFAIFPNTEKCLRYPFTLYTSENGMRQETTILRSRGEGGFFVFTCSKTDFVQFNSLVALARCLTEHPKPELRYLPLPGLQDYYQR